MRPWQPPLPPAPASLHGPLAGFCFPGVCGQAQSSRAHAKVPGLRLGCSEESPGSAPRPRARRRCYSESRGESKPRLEEPAGSTAHCEATSMRPFPSRPFPSPHQPDLGSWALIVLMNFWLLLFWSLNVILAASNVSRAPLGLPRRVFREVSVHPFSQILSFFRGKGSGPCRRPGARRRRLGLGGVCAAALGAPGRRRRRFSGTGHREGSKRIFPARSPCTATSLGPLGLIYVVRGSSRQSRGGGGGASRSLQ